MFIEINKNRLLLIFLLFGAVELKILNNKGFNIFLHN